MDDAIVGSIFGSEAIHAIVVSWAHWTEVPADLAEDQFEQKREELNAAIERARLRALAYFGKATANG